MYEFGEKLTELIQKYNAKASDICDNTGIKKAYFSKMKNGTILPQDCSVVREVANTMAVSDEEKSQLCRLYCKSKLDKRYIRIHDAIKEIYCVSTIDSAESTDKNNTALKNGTVITGTANVMMSIKNMMTQCRTADVILASDTKELFYLIAEQLYKNNNVKCRCLLYMEDSEFSDFNINVFSNAVPVLLTEKVNLRYNYANTEDLSEHSFVSQIFIVENSVLLVDSKCTTAVYLEGEDAANIYTKAFEEKFERSKELCKVFSDISGFINGYSEIFEDNDSAELQDVYIIKNCPCIMLEMNSDVINNHFKDDDIRVEFVKKYMDFLYRHIITGVKKQHIIFSENGIEKLLNAEEYYEYNKYINNYSKGYNNKGNNYSKSYNNKGNNYSKGYNNKGNNYNKGYNNYNDSNNKGYNNIINRNNTIYNNNNRSNNTCTYNRYKCYIFNNSDNCYNNYNNNYRLNRRYNR